MIRRDVTVPKGSGGRGSDRSSLEAELQRARRREVAIDRGEPAKVMEQKGRTGREAKRQGAKEQARNVDPGMGEAERRPLFEASERPLRATGSVEERRKKAAAGLEALNLVPGKTA